jgi:peptidoglycan/LPS O-acetylase OafA/YrhL
MLPGAAGVHFGTNGPLWSLAYEFIYYALYPLLLAARVRYGPGTYVAVAGLCIFLSAVIPLRFAGEALQLYSLWLAGAVLVEAMVARRLRLSPALGLGSFVAGLAGIHWLKGVPAVVPYLLLGFGAVAFAATVPAHWSRWRIHRALHWVGIRSYTLYICHFSFLALLSAVTIETLGRRPSSGWLALAGAAAALAWCSLLWWLVERRFMHERLSAPRARPGEA